MSLQWNPGVADRSGEIFSNAAGNAAKIRLGGTMAMAEGIQQAGQSIEDGLSDSMGKILTKKIEDGRMAEMNLGRRDALAAIGPEYGLDPKMLDTLLNMEAKQPQRMSAMLDVFEQHVGQQMKNSYIDKQSGLSMQRAGHQAGLTRETQLAGIYGRADAAVPPNMRPVQPVTVLPDMQGMGTPTNFGNINFDFVP